MTTLVQKPVLHGRDHCPDGPDPIPCLGAGGVGDFETAVLSISDLLAYWRLGEPAGPWADTSGVLPGPDNLIEHGTGTALGADVTGALPTSQDDGALEFNYDGTASGGRYAQTGGAATKNFGLAQMTVAVWVKVKASALTRRGLVIGNSNIQAGTHNKVGWGIQVIYPARTVRFTRGEIGGGAEKYAETPGGVVAGDWNLFVGTYDGTTIRLYANGAQVASSPDTSGIAATDGSGTVSVGYGFGEYISFSAIPSWFYGTADEAAVWTRALTASEVATLYAGGTGTSGPDELGDGSVFNRHVNTAANIDVLKLAHPGGTSSFLRADGTWAAPTVDPAAATSAWMPLIDSDGTCVLDDTGNLIPTLITL